MADGDPLTRRGGGGGGGEKRARASASFADAAAAAEEDGLLLLLDGLSPSPAKKVRVWIRRVPLRRQPRPGNQLPWRLRPAGCIVRCVSCQRRN